MHRPMHSSTGRPSRLRPWHDAFPPVSDFPPYFRKIFRLYGKFSKIYLFPKNFSITFFLFSHRPQISNFTPIFPVSVNFHLFRENYYSPTFKNSPCFRKIHLLFNTLCVFRFPPTLTMMHSCITQYTYWTPLHSSIHAHTYMYIRPTYNGEFSLIRSDID